MEAATFRQTGTTLVECKQLDGDMVTRHWRTERHMPPRWQGKHRTVSTNTKRGQRDTHCKKMCTKMKRASVTSYEENGTVMGLTSNYDIHNVIE